MKNHADIWLKLGIALFVVLLAGVPLYITAPAGYLYIALILHVVLVAIYVAMLLYFGPGAIIESGVSVFVFSIIFAVLLPVYVRSTPPRPNTSPQQTEAQAQK